MPFLRKYNTLLVTGSTAIRIPIIKRASVDFAVGADWTPAAGDVKIAVDGAAVANVTNLPTAVAMGNTAYWEFILTAAELSGKQIIVTVADAATKAVEDQSFLVETYGNASAMYAADFSAANLPANAVQIAGAAVSATTAQIGVNVVNWNNSVVATPTVAGVPEVDITHVNGSLTTATLDTIKTETASIQADTNDIQTRLPAALVSGRMDASVGAMAANTLTAAATAADFGSEIATAVWQDATAGDFTVASSIGKALYVNNIAPGAAGGHFISGSNAGTTTVGALTVTGATTLTGNVALAAGMNITQSSGNTSALVITGNGTGHGAVITSGSGATGDGVQITAASTNGNGLKLTKTGTGVALASPTTDIVLAKTTNITGFNDIAATAIVSGGAITTSGGAVSTVSAVTGLTAANLDVAVSTRMATYTQPTGFLAATFPATVASTTNITAGTITTATNVTTVNGLAANVITAASLAADASTEIRSLASGTSDSGTTTTMVDAARTEADTDYWKGCLIVFTSGTLLGQARLITGFTPGTDTITYAPATTQAAGTHTYEIWPAGRVDVNSWLGTTAATPSVAGVPEVDLTHVNGAATTATLDTIKAETATILSDTNDIQTRLPAALVSGRMDASVGAMASNVMTAAATAADYVTELQSGLSTLNAAAVSTAVWDAATASYGSAGTYGALVETNLDATVSSRLATAGYTAPDNASIAAILVDTGTTLQAELDGIQADTEDIQARLPAALVSGRIDASVGAMAANTLTAAATAADFGAEIADAVHDEVVEGTTTLRESVRLANAALGGKASGLDTATAVYRDIGDTKDRITATVDADGNRTAVSRDLT